MRSVLLGLWLSAFVCLAACGGKYRRSASRGLTAADEGSSAAGASSKDETFDPFGAPGTTLSECVKGVPEGAAQAAVCPWVVDGYCYAERAMACNCACPHDRDSQCSSGFDRGPTGRVPVDCF